MGSRAAIKHWCVKRNAVFSVSTHCLSCAIQLCIGLLASRQAFQPYCLSCLQLLKVLPKLPVGKLPNLPDIAGPSCSSIANGAGSSLSHKAIVRAAAATLMADEGCVTPLDFLHQQRSAISGFLQSLEAACQRCEGDKEGQSQAVLESEGRRAVLFLEQQADEWRSQLQLEVSGMLASRSLPEIPPTSAVQ